MPKTHHAGAAASSLDRGVFRTVAALALLGLIGYLAATGQLANGATQSHATVSLRSTALGKVLVTSQGPQGNIGYPGQPAEIDHFMKMIKSSTNALSPEDLKTIEAVLRWLFSFVTHGRSARVITKPLEPSPP